MANFIIGGWTQNPKDPAPPQFAYTMYGMITNLAGLTAGTAAEPGWSPARTPAPSAAGKVMWTYGGAGCAPQAMPAAGADITAVGEATRKQGWAGVDFDDECGMNVDNMVETMKMLRPMETSYTFLAGWDYNNPNASALGRATNAAVHNIAEANVCDRFILMCYGGAMWSTADIEANVGPALDRTMENGVEPSKVILALTPAGLNDQNLSYFLNQVKDKQVGGLFIWNYTTLDAKHFSVICNELGI